MARPQRPSESDAVNHRTTLLARHGSPAAKTLNDFVNRCQHSVGVFLFSGSSQRIEALATWLEIALHRQENVEGSLQATALLCFLRAVSQCDASTDIVVDVSRCLHHATPSRSLVISDQRATRIVTTLGTLYQDPGLSEVSLARHCTFSTSTLSHVFCGTVGVAVRNVLKTIRVARAIRFLASGQRPPVKVLANMVGYRHVSAFDRDFRQICRVDPTTAESLLSTEPNIAAFLYERGVPVHD